MMSLVDSMKERECPACKKTKKELQFYAGRATCAACVSAQNKKRYHAKKRGTWKPKRRSPRRGERNGNARLSLDEVREIRAHLRLGKRAREIAELYGVDKSHIYSIKRGRVWGGIK